MESALTILLAFVGGYVGGGWMKEVARARKRAGEGPLFK